MVEELHHSFNLSSLQITMLEWREEAWAPAQHRTKERNQASKERTSRLRSILVNFARYKLLLNHFSIRQHKQHKRQEFLGSCLLFALQFSATSILSRVQPREIKPLAPVD
jgi:hypothetical protein